MKKLVTLSALVFILFGCKKEKPIIFSGTCICSASENGFTEHKLNTKKDLEQIKNVCLTNGCEWINQ